MSIVHLYDNFIGPPSVLTDPGGTAEIGAAWASSQDGQVNGLRYWAVVSTTTDHPTRIALWDGVTGALIAYRDVTDHDGLIGWKEFAFGTPIPVTAYHRYVVALSITNGKHFGGTSTLFAPPSPLQWESNPKVQSVHDGIYTYPNSTYGSWPLVDVVFSGSGTPAPSPDYDTGIENAFVRWESTTDNTRPLGLPVLTKTQVDLIKSVVDLIKTGVDNVPKAGDSTFTELGKLWKIAGALTDAEIAAFNLFAKRAPSQLTGATAQGGSGFIAIGDSLDSVYSGLQGTLAGLQSLVEWSTGDVLVPGKVTSQGTHDFTGPEVWPSTWPLHRVTITSYPAGQGGRLLSNGVRWLPRLGSWSPVAPDGALSRRYPLEYDAQWLFPCPRGTAGVSVLVAPGTTGTIEAFSHP